jgi:hypothetical protein
MATYQHFRRTSLNQSPLDPFGATFTGSKYQFGSKKMRRWDTCDAESTCNPVKPDAFALGDGQKYDISQLDDVLLSPLIEFAFNGTTADVIPEVYKDLALEG